MFDTHIHNCEELTSAFHPFPPLVGADSLVRMKWLKALADRFKRPEGLYPERLWTVSFDGSAVFVTDQTGKTMSVMMQDLRTVAIATNDSGPWGADVWWLLYGSDGNLACGFPQGATGEKEVLDALMAMPGFDQSETIKAMGCTSNATFIVWQRS